METATPGVAGRGAREDSAGWRGRGLDRLAWVLALLGMLVGFGQAVQIGFALGVLHPQRHVSPARQALELTSPLGLVYLLVPPVVAAALSTGGYLLAGRGRRGLARVSVAASARRFGLLGLSGAGLVLAFVGASVAYRVLKFGWLW